MTKTPQQILDDMEPNLIKDGYIPRTVELPNGEEAEFWVKKKEVWIVGPNTRTRFPWIDPDGCSDEDLARRIHGFLPWM